MRKVLFLIMTIVALSLFAMPACAQGGDVAASGGTNWVAITSGFSMAIASGLCAIGQGRAIGDAAQGIARNPAATAAIRGALILGLVLIESLALYTLLIIFLKVV